MSAISNSSTIPTNDTTNEVSTSESGLDLKLTIIAIIGVVVILYSLTIAWKLSRGMISHFFVEIFFMTIGLNLLFVVVLMISFAFPANQTNCMGKMILTRALFSCNYTVFAITSYIRYKMLVDPLSVKVMDKSKFRRNIIFIFLIDFVFNVVTSILDERHIFVRKCANIDFEGDDGLHTIPQVVFFIVRSGVLITSSYFDYLTVNSIIEKKKTHMAKFAKEYIACYYFPMLTGLLPPLSLVIMCILVTIAGLMTQWRNIHTDLMSAAVINSTLLIGCLVIGTFITKKNIEEQKRTLNQMNQLKLRIVEDEARPPPNPNRLLRAFDQRLEKLHHPPEQNLEEDDVQPVKEVPHQQNQLVVQVDVHSGREILETDEVSAKIQRFLAEIATFSFIDDDDEELV